MPNALQGLLADPRGEMRATPRNKLADLAQGVSRGFWADGIGGPVDMITMLANLGIAGGGYVGHKAGLLKQPPGLIENPVGGSEWIAQQMRQRGLLADNPGSTADTYGRVVGGLLGPLTAAKAPQVANALNKAPEAMQRGAYAVGERAAGMLENQLVRQGSIQPMMLYHGSARPLDGGVFDLGRVGSTTGAATEGWGAYHSLDKKNATRFGKSITKVDLPDDVAANVLLDWDKPIAQQGPLVQKIAAMYEKDASDPVEAAKNFFKWQRSIGRMDTAARQQAAKLSSAIYQDNKVAKLDVDKFNQILGEMYPKNPGYMSARIIGAPFKDGKEFYDFMRNTSAGSQKSAAGTLGQLGIKGSIMNSENDINSAVLGTRNVVIHDQDLLNKYTVR